MFEIVGTAVCFVGVLWFLRHLFRSWKGRDHHPPGPSGLPLIGTIKFPAGPPYETYRRWGEQYKSDIVRVNALGNNIIILNSYEAAIDLLDKRSSIYSDRPSSGFTMLSELCGLGWLFAFARYGQEWRDGRKAFQREFDHNIVKKYRSHERREVIKLLNCLLVTPDGFMTNIRMMTGGLILSIAYGIDVQGQNDPLLKAADTAVGAIDATLVPGAYLVDLFPILKHVPEWFPGARFKTQARVWKQSVLYSLHRPWQIVKDRMASGQEDTPECAAKSLIENVISTAKDPEYMERVVRAAVGSMYLAGSDTTTFVIQSFFLAMVLYPDVQRKAQASIDQVCIGRLPDFTDYESLPCIHAIVKECLRWHPVSSLRKCTKDDVYRQYIIPEGSIVLANNWAMLHDSRTYPDPEKFNPERFLKYSNADKKAVVLDTDVRDPASILFGFGRRICPGRFMAYESIWIAMASVLAMFNIDRAVDKDGQPVTPGEDYRCTFIVGPKPFPCRITPRSEAHADLIREAAENL